MKIKSVRLKNFTVHDASTLELPDTGLVLIQGANGCLRGNTPIHDPVDGSTLTYSNAG